jgi:hypothetical protein
MRESRALPNAASISEHVFRARRPVACSKIFSFSRAANQSLIGLVPAREKGVSRSSRTLGPECDGRGNIVARLARGRTMLSRTAKSCGPDAPTLASSERQHPLMTGAIKPGPRGEREGNRKTIVQGMPGRFRRTCGRLPCAFYTLHTGLRVLRAPGIPCAFPLKVALRLLGLEGRYHGSTRAHQCSENAESCLRRPFAGSADVSGKNEEGLTVCTARPPPRQFS